MATFTGNVYTQGSFLGFTAPNATFTLNVAATAALANGIANNNSTDFDINANGDLTYVSTVAEEGTTVCAVVDVTQDCCCDQFEVCMPIEPPPCVTSTTDFTITRDGCEDSLLSFADIYANANPTGFATGTPDFTVSSGTQNGTLVKNDLATQIDLQPAFGDAGTSSTFVITFNDGTCVDQATVTVNWTTPTVSNFNFNATCSSFLTDAEILSNTTGFTSPTITLISQTVVGNVTDGATGFTIDADKSDEGQSRTLTFQITEGVCSFTQIVTVNFDNFCAGFSAADFSFT